MAAAKTKVVSLKLLIDTQSKRLLFAEASKDFVDFLFQIQSLPVGTVIHLLKKQGRIGSLTNLYESIENLNNSYMQSEQIKNTLLEPIPLSLVSAISTAENLSVGFVKDKVTYMVMDDLVVTPFSAISSMAFLHKLDIHDFNVVEEKVVNFGMDEAVKLLNASLHTNKVLSDVFLNCTSSKKRNADNMY